MKTLLVSKMTDNHLDARSISCKGLPGVLSNAYLDINSKVMTHEVKF